MTTPETALSKTVDSLQDCIDYAATNTSIILVKYNVNTGACTGSTYYTAYGYYTNIDKIVNYILSHRCMNSVTISDAERLIIDNLFQIDTCPQVYFTKNGSFSTGLSYSLYTNYYCYQPYTMPKTNTSVYDGPYSNWQVGMANITSGADGVQYSSFIMNRAQLTLMTQYTCGPYMSDRLYYGDQIYCYNKTASFKANGTTTTACSDVLTDGYPMRFVSSMVYDKIYGMPNLQYKPFAGLILDSNKTYMYADGAALSNTTKLSWVSGYPKGYKVVVVSQNLKVYDISGSTTSVMHCMSDPTVRSGSTVCTAT
ncbi:unnamed protein product [Bursaphelenchus okinawaensis]|uniref:Uncharacterized protein n=1 Tax=Bursaphelenchus okinawaensis TaxID=465554 RepID=A0A811KT38_9BILA|nr:unnamed protein product [Bursaphelenchus okinawaensis]CAG9111134.1 unnamed protein product [Bursaphelenchus okinawaensis]